MIIFFLFKAGWSHIDKLEEINFDSIRLCFQVFDRDNGKQIGLVVSHVFRNKNAYNEPRICHISRRDSSVNGGDEIYLLCNRIKIKKKIIVRFFEQNDEKKVIWKEELNKSHLIIHHQCAMILKSPPYHDKYLMETRKCFIQLDSDGENSEAIEFEYTPCQQNSMYICVFKKKKININYNHKYFHRIHRIQCKKIM